MNPCQFTPLHVPDISGAKSTFTETLLCSVYVRNFQMMVAMSRSFFRSRLASARNADASRGIQCRRLFLRLLLCPPSLTARVRLDGMLSRRMPTPPKTRKFSAWSYLRLSLPWHVTAASHRVRHHSHFAACAAVLGESDTILAEYSRCNYEMVAILLSTKERSLA